MPQAEFVGIDLIGRVTAPIYGAATNAFGQLVEAISSDYRGGEDIEWIITELRASDRYIAPYEGTRIQATPTGGEPELEERAVHTFLAIGSSLQGNVPIRNPRFARPAYSLVSVLNGRVSAVYFRAPSKQIYISEPVKIPRTTLPRDYGVIEGEVETIRRRRSLQFTLYDSLYDRAVTCHVRQDQEDLMREIWGHNVAVHGWISRDPESGRPLEVSDIVSIDSLPESAPDSYLRARGAVTFKSGSPSPEEIIRQMRDAG